MSETPVETDNLLAQNLSESNTTYPQVRSKKNILVQELLSFWITLGSPLFYLSLLVSLILLVAAYQFPFTRSVSIDKVGDRAFLSNYYAREQYADFVYRWTQPNSNVRLPGVGQPAYLKVKLELSPRPPDAPKTTVNYNINGERFYSFELDTGPPKFYEKEYYPVSRPFFSFDKGEFDFWMNVDPPYLAKGDQRPFGVVVSQIEIRGSGLFETGRPTIPPWQTVLLLMASLAILHFAGRRAGFGIWPSSILTLALATLLSTGIGFDRTLIGLTAPVLLVSMLLGYLFLVVGLVFVGWWLGRRSISLGKQQAQWLGLIFVLAFVIRAAGINHPTFQVLDHGFRVHEAMALREQPLKVLTNYYNVNTAGSVSGNGQDRSVTLGQWGLSVAIPYPPLFYLLDLPLAQLLYTDEKVLLYWTNLFALWWDTTSIFLVYIIARQIAGRFGNTTGLVGAALTGFFPLSFLMPSDGGYPTMLAQWLTLLFLAILTAQFWERRAIRLSVSWKSIIGAGVVLGLAMLAHTATMLLLLGFIFLLWTFLGLWGNRYSYLAKPVFLTGVVGTIFSFGLYYGFYVIPLLTKTFPALAGKVGSGETVGDADRTLKGFWPELSAHFHFFPFVLTLAGLGFLLYASRQGEKKKVPIKQESFTGAVLNEVSRTAILMLCAWFGVFLFFSIASLRINLLHKHMLFALPLFALMSGLTLALCLEYLRQKKLPELLLRLAQFSPFALAAYFIAAGCYTWFIRVVLYILPAGTG